LTQNTFNNPPVIFIYSLALFSIAEIPIKMFLILRSFRIEVWSGISFHKSDKEAMILSIYLRIEPFLNLLFAHMQFLKIFLLLLFLQSYRTR
jgi:hypothetical protein